MFYKVWNADKAQFALATRMDAKAAGRVADTLEARTGDQHVLVRA